jgi:hypothetical protein
MMDIQDFYPVTVDDWQKAKIEEIGQAYATLAGFILTNTASSAHRTAALRLLLDSKMTMVHALSHP